jgi:hypothetical protein
MLESLRSAVLKTLCYADLFDYPLTQEELFKWLIGCQVQKKYWASFLKTMDMSIIQKTDKYFYLRTRRKIVSVREKRRLLIDEKMAIARRATKLLAYIPTIECVGISGSLAMGNADSGDDIDLLIITSSGHLWITRFLATLILELVGMRRRPGTYRYKNKVCLNMYLDRDHLPIPSSECDIYAAHELVQMLPLYNKNNTYKSFIRINSWVKHLLPHAYSECLNRYKERVYRRHRRGIRRVYLRKVNIVISCVLERIAGIVQLVYMGTRRSTETVEEGYLRFHKKDARAWVIPEYLKRLKRFKIS